MCVSFCLELSRISSVTRLKGTAVPAFLPPFQMQTRHESGPSVTYSKFILSLSLWKKTAVGRALNDLFLLRKESPFLFLSAFFFGNCYSCRSLRKQKESIDAILEI